MKKVMMTLVCATMLLSACGKTDAGSEKKTTKETTVVMTEKQTSTTSHQEERAVTETDDSSKESEQTAEGSTETVVTDANYNGIYYSVKGKYGDVIIVNKKHPVAATYAPGEDPTALVAFNQLVADMQAEGFAVSNAYSGFRSYDTQVATYNGYLASDSQANVDTYSARPGYSEHQTGLAFDLLDSSGQLLTEPQAATWLANHAHDYGFVVRYLAGKEASTGYMAESWHVRYIGSEASEIYQSGKTLEEYYGVAGGDYAN